MKSHFLVASAVVVAVAFASAPAVASDKTDVMAVVNKAVADFNKGDMNGWVAACSTPATIIDEFAPYHWQGPTACADWWKDFEADGKKNDITAAAVKIAKVRHTMITGDHAYVVLTTSFSFKLKGKATVASGSSWTIALNKTAAGWRIAGWAWAAK